MLGSYQFAGCIESRARAQEAPKLDIFDAKQTRKKGRVGANVTNGAPENAVLERYGRGRFAVPVHSDDGH